MNNTGTRASTLIYTTNRRGGTGRARASATRCWADRAGPTLVAKPRPGWACEEQGRTDSPGRNYQQGLERVKSTRSPLIESVNCPRREAWAGLSPAWRRIPPRVLRTFRTDCRESPAPAGNCWGDVCVACCCQGHARATAKDSLPRSLVFLLRLAGARGVVGR